MKTILLVIFCYSSMLAGVAQQTVGNKTKTPVIVGAWKLDSIQSKNENEVVNLLSGNLPEDLFYTCPKKIEIKDASNSVFQFGNTELKNVYYYIYTDQGREYIQFSYPGQGSVPERQYDYILNADKKHLALIYPGSPIQYLYYYSSEK